MPKEQGEQVMVPIENVQAMLQALLAESRKPVIDPIKEQQKARMKEHNRALQKDAHQIKINRFQNCTHMQRPGSILTGCSAIAWATQSDGVVRGFCQHCQTLFSPVAGECASKEIHESYNSWRRVPTHPSGNVVYT